MTKQYTVEKWNGFANFRCSQCGFASLSEADIKAHIKQHSPLPVTEEKTKPKTEKVEETKEKERKFTWA
jgi:phage FluMu protein Com